MAADATTLLLAWRRGDRAALNELIPLVYQELRRLAHRRLAGQRAGHTLQTTALVHEAYLQLVDCGQVRWQDRTHFLAVSANLMRRILVDYARARNADKRGGAAPAVTLDENAGFTPPRGADLAALDDSLEALAAVDPRKSKVVELKFFGGLDTGEIAAVLGVSEQTVLRDWKLAKVWLLRDLTGRP
ncbi:MAG TPA: sigma-70 family RNA polymerase sigma factor [Candidatus Acidoferrales bacterium]|nr:sigma-70 family RNA polymerase sigma factor [Candidatus Acidoferrales bacterium]